MNNKKTDEIKSAAQMLHFLNAKIEQPTPDEIIDILATERIIIYDAFEPFVDPTDPKGRVLCRLKVKRYHPHGWNFRLILGSSSLTYDRNQAKKECIKIALDYLNEIDKLQR